MDLGGGQRHTVGVEVEPVEANRTATFSVAIAIARAGLRRRVGCDDIVLTGERSSEREADQQATLHVETSAASSA